MFFLQNSWKIHKNFSTKKINTNNLDGDFTRNFILTYQYFTTAEQLFEELIKRFRFHPPPQASVEVIMYYNKWRGPVRLRVINVLKKWVEVNFSDVLKNKPLLSKFKTFVEEIGTTPDYEKWRELLIELLKNAECPKEK